MRTNEMNKKKTRKVNKNVRKSDCLDEFRPIIRSARGKQQKNKSPIKIHLDLS